MMKVTTMSSLRSGSTSHGVNGSQPDSIRQLNSGVLLLTAGHDLLYVTPNAHRMLQHLAESENSPPSPTRLPSIIREICEEMEDARQQCASPSQWAAIQAHRVALTTHSPLALRGFVIPHWNSPPTNSLLIILEVLATSKPSAAPAALHPPLTARQEAIAQGLMRGLTNKELANELSLSTHTVKEYIRVIMSKVQATTRAGVVARLVGATPQSLTLLQGRSQPERHPSSGG